MKDLLYNLDSIEVSYGDNVLNTVVQINERINDIASNQEMHLLNDFDKSQIVERVNKLQDLNQVIQNELAEQTEKLASIKNNIFRELDIA